MAVMHTFIPMHKRTYERKYTYISYIHTCLHTYIHTYVHTYTRTYTGGSKVNQPLLREHLDNPAEPKVFQTGLTWGLLADW